MVSQVVTELPEGQKVLIFTFNVVLKDQTIEEAVDNMRPLMLLVFYFVDKIRRYRLSRYVLRENLFSDHIWARINSYLSFYKDHIWATISRLKPLLIPRP